MNQEEVLNKIATTKQLIETEITPTHPLSHLRGAGLQLLDTISMQVQRGEKLKEASAMLEKLEALWGN